MELHRLSIAATEVVGDKAKVARLYGWQCVVGFGLQGKRDELIKAIPGSKKPLKN